MSDSIRNILSNIFLFTFGIFLPRSSRQLEVYFGLPAKMRLMGALAYTSIFVAMFFLLFALISDSIFVPRVLIPIIPSLLIFLTLFNLRFRKSYHIKLLLISLVSMISLWVADPDSQEAFKAGWAASNSRRSMPADSTRSMENHLLQEAKSEREWQYFGLSLNLAAAFSFFLEVMKEVNSRKTRAETEIQLARRIQERLLPPREINHPLFRLYGQTLSANVVGGDYFDAVKLSDEKWGVAIGDVSGHNVAAGLLMAVVKTAFRAELHHFKNLTSLVSLLNNTVYENKDKAMFVSFLCCVFDFSEQVLDIVNAGHLPLFHFRKLQNEVLEHTTNNLALGLQNNASFSSKRVSFSTGDTFLFITDGVMEAENSDGVEFGLDHVQEFMKRQDGTLPKNYFTQLTKEIDSFVSSVPQKDDLTILSVHAC